MTNVNIEHQALISQEEYELFIKLRDDLDQVKWEYRNKAHIEAKSELEWYNRGKINSYYNELDNLEMKIQDKENELQYRIDTKTKEINRITPVPTLMKLFKKWFRIETYGEDLK